MADQHISVVLEFPASIAQQEIWNLEKELQHIKGVETDLQQPRDIQAVITLFLQITGDVGVVAASIASVCSVAEILYKFLHREDKNKVSEEGKKKVVLKQGDKAIELYNYSIEEIRQLLSRKK